MTSSRRMASSRKLRRISHAAFATPFAAACLLWANAAFASQGPGGGPGTASSFTQLADRCGAPALSARNTLAATPIAVHVRHDYRTARPVFLNVSCGAVPHGVGTGVIAGPDIRFPFVTRIDRQAS